MRGELFRRLLRAGAHATFVQTSSVKEPGLASEAHSPSASRSPPDPGRSRFLRSALALSAPGKERFSPIPGGLSTLFLQIFPAGFPVPRRALRNPLAAGSRQTQREDHTSPKIKVKGKNADFFRGQGPAIWFPGRLCQGAGWTDTDKHGRTRTGYGHGQARTNTDRLRTRTSTDEHGQAGEGVWYFARPSVDRDSRRECSLSGFHGAGVSPPGCLVPPGKCGTGTGKKQKKQKNA